MAHVYLLVFQGHLHLGRELQQAHVVGDGGAALADALRNLGLRHARCLGQVLIGQGNLDGIQVLALNILNQRHLHHVLVLDCTDVSRY